VSIVEGKIDTDRYWRWHNIEPHNCLGSDPEPRCDPVRLVAWVHEQIGVPMPNGTNAAREYVTDIEWGEGGLTVDTVDADQLTPERDDCVRHTYTVQVRDLPPAWPWGIA
jgi:hypothetical protein